MPLISGAEKVKLLILRKDYEIQVASMAVEKYAPNIITQKQNEERVRGWWYIYQLLKPCYNVPGVRDGEKALIAIPGDSVFDPLEQLDDTWNKANINKAAAEYAKEQEHKADANKVSSFTNVSMILISTAVVILVIGMLLIGGLKYYGA